MILINLLPEEYVKARRTPLQAMAVIGGMVTVNAMLLAWLATMTFGTKSRIDSDLEFLESDMASLTPQVDYNEELDKENKQFMSREATLESITKGRVNWTEKVDQLVDIVNFGGDGEKYLVWLNDLTVVQSVPKASKSGPQSGGTFRATGYSGSPNFGLVANFFEDLTEDQFIDGFYAPSPPQGRREDKDEGLVPSEIFSFTLDLQLQPREESK